jgi:hypothetical protein
MDRILTWSWDGNGLPEIYSIDGSESGKKHSNVGDLPEQRPTPKLMASSAPLPQSE